MVGPELFARALTGSQISDQFGNSWQYHSRSDNHSKIACGALLLDLLNNCPLLASHARDGKIVFGINHEMRDFKTARQKNLDLIICTPKASAASDSTLSAYFDKYKILLTPHEQGILAGLPVIRSADVGSVFVAVEAKAAMTAHVKALPRLYDELNSSHLAIHGSAESAIAVGLAFVNVSPTFASSDRNKFDLTKLGPQVTAHRQPHDARRTIDKLLELPRRTHQGSEGFDALGIVLVDFANDGSKVSIVEDPKELDTRGLDYAQMVHRVSSLYATNFREI